MKDKGNIVNNFAEGSVTMQAGSTINGEVTISGPIYQGIPPQSVSSEDDAADDEKGIGSPICLSSQRGVKIDFIRVMNAWYECGKVEKVGGGHLTKKEYFTWLGKLFNIDLSNYCKDLSNSMSAAVSYEKQTHIFEELKKKENEIYNKK